LWYGAVAADGGGWRQQKMVVQAAVWWRSDGGFNMEWQRGNIDGGGVVVMTVVTGRSQILGDPKSSVQTRSRVQQNSGAHALEEPKKISKALKEDSWVKAMQEELLYQAKKMEFLFLKTSMLQTCLASVKTAITPMETKMALTKDEEADEVDLDECLALADLGASINLMPLSVWKKLSLSELTSTRMTLELVDRSVAHPKGVAKDVFVKVGKFYFLADFVVVDYDVDPRVPRILGRPFLRTTRALIDVHGEELTLRVDDEAITFKVRNTSRYSRNYYDETVHQVNVIDVGCEEYAQEGLGFLDSSKSGNTTPSDPIIASSSPSFTLFERGDFILEEIEACLLSDSIPPGIDDADFDSE
ncbi:reverse transcriptase domain-containing protein, partial [Tanacetum coccineum]